MESWAGRDSLLIDLSLIGSLSSSLFKLAQSGSTGTLSDDARKYQHPSKTISEILDSLGTIQVRPNTWISYRISSPPRISKYIDDFLNTYLKQNPRAADDLRYLQDSIQKHILSFVLSHLPEDKWPQYLQRVFRGIEEYPDWRKRQLAFHPRDLQFRLHGPNPDDKQRAGWASLSPVKEYEDDAIRYFTIVDNINVYVPEIVSRFQSDYQYRKNLRTVLHELGHTTDQEFIHMLAGQDASEVYQKAHPAFWRDYVTSHLTVDSNWIVQDEKTKDWYLKMPNNVSIRLADGTTTKSDLVKRLNAIRYLIESNKVDFRIIELARFDSTISAPEYYGPRSLIAFVYKTDKLREDGTERPIYLFFGSYLVPTAVIDPNIKTPDATKFHDEIEDFRLNLAAFNISLARDFYDDIVAPYMTIVYFLHDEVHRYIESTGPNVPITDLSEVIAVCFERYMVKQVTDRKPILTFNDFVRAIYDMTALPYTYQPIAEMLRAESHDILFGKGGRKMDYRKSLLYFLWKNLFSGFAKNLNRATLERIKGLA
ncbi:MAG: hypothetical protein QXW98_04280 [Candidatus Caldarchaeum sp.]